MTRQGGPANEASDETEQLVTALLTASRVLVAVSSRSLAGVADALTMTQFRCLVVLSTHGVIRLNRLAELLGVNASTALRTVDKLVLASLVTRTENPTDRREVLLDLTTAGRAVVDQTTRRRRTEIAAIVDQMPPNRRAEIVAALEAFTEAAGEPSAAGRGTDW